MMNDYEFQTLKSYKQKLVSVKDTYPDVYNAIVQLRKHVDSSNVNETIQEANSIVSKTRNRSLNLDLETSFDTFGKNPDNSGIFKRSFVNILSCKIIDHTHGVNPYAKFIGADDRELVYMEDVTPADVKACLANFLKSKYWSVAENDTAWLKAHHIPQSHVLN